MALKIARVGLDVPRAQLFDYLWPDAAAERIGCRVLVPFGRRTMLGVILEMEAESALAPERLRRLTRVVDAAPLLSDEDLRLLRFAADYYQYPLGQVVMHALPVKLRRPESMPRPQREYALTHLGRAQAVEALPSRARVKRELLTALQGANALSAAAVAALGATATKAVKAFEAQGWVEVRDVVEHALAPPQTPDVRLHVIEGERPANAAQLAAVDAIVAALDRFQPFLLFGVTGSGKTEVYLRAADAVLRRGDQVLMLVPEIALTPQLEAMVQARFPAMRLVSLHSGLGEAERAHNWHAARNGEAQLVLGTRLAVFASLPRLGLVVVDEEHDPSFKQTEGFCYSARDLAVVRASYRRIPVVLGSATPSLETWHNAQTGRYQRLDLPERINGRPPHVTCISLRGTGSAAAAFHPQLLDEIAQRLGRREQTLVFLNRRGYAPVLMCHACGWLSGCHRCSAQLVLHLARRELQCHHCGHRERVPSACPTCGNQDLSPIGQGTQRVEEQLKVQFADARVLRIDRDSTRRRNAWPEMRDRIGRREVDILVGTQILAKGHDFPHLALVCVLNADGMLYSADFRASERLYALLTQVAGRAGRGEAQGEVLIQTEFAQHPLYTALRTQDFAAYAETLLAERREAGFPPFVHQALLRAEAAEVDTALAFLEHAKEMGRALADGVELYDPVPAAMVRLAGRERAQLLAQSRSRRALHGFLSAWRDLISAEKSPRARWTLEVDPLEL